MPQRTRTITLDQYINKITDLLRTHVPDLSGQTRHIAGFAGALVAEDNRPGSGSVSTTLDGYLRSSRLRNHRDSLDPIIVPLATWRTQVKVGSVSADTVAAPDAGLSKDDLAATIRAFIQSDQPHLTRARRKGATSDQVDALLQILGLMDVPTPAVSEPDSEGIDGDTRALLQRLVSFARQHGFGG